MRTFDSFDTDNSGRISEREFMTAVLKEPSENVSISHFTQELHDHMRRNPSFQLFIYIFLLSSREEDFDSPNGQESLATGKHKDHRKSKNPTAGHPGAPSRER